MLFTIHASSQNAIFNGGDGDGYALDEYAETAGNIFNGGNGDGWATATILFNLENGKTDRTEIIYGKDVEARWFDPETEPERKKTKAAWVSPANLQASKSLRLYVKTWNNPWPEVKVRSIEFVSEMGVSAPFLVAITAE